MTNVNNGTIPSIWHAIKAMQLYNVHFNKFIKINLFQFFSLKNCSWSFHLFNCVSTSEQLDLNFQQRNENVDNNIINVLKFWPKREVLTVFVSMLFHIYSKHEDVTNHWVDEQMINIHPIYTLHQLYSVICPNCMNLWFINSVPFAIWVKTVKGEWRFQWLRSQYKCHRICEIYFLNRKKWHTWLTNTI